MLLSGTCTFVSLHHVSIGMLLRRFALRLRRRSCLQLAVVLFLERLAFVGGALPLVLGALHECHRRRLPLK